MTDEELLKRMREKSKRDDKIFINIVIIFLVIYLINEGLNYLVPNIRFKDKVEDYLIRNYHYVYELKFEEMHYGTIYKEITRVDGAACECPVGNDKFVEKYVFSYKLNAVSEDVYYVTYENNIRNRSVRIYDSTKHGSEISNQKLKYVDYMEFENQRNEVSKFIVDNYAVGYSGNFVNIDNGFNITTKRSLQEELINNFEEFSALYNATVELLKGKDDRLYIDIQYADAKIRITNTSEIITETTISKVFN